VRESIEYRFRVQSAAVFTLYSYSKALEYRFRVPTTGSLKCVAVTASELDPLDNSNILTPERPDDRWLEQDHVQYAQSVSAGPAFAPLTIVQGSGTQGTGSAHEQRAKELARSPIRSIQTWRRRSRVPCWRAPSNQARRQRFCRAGEPVAVRLSAVLSLRPPSLLPPRRSAGDGWATRTRIARTAAVRDSKMPNSNSRISCLLV
jgi:hypothetical protein